MTQDIGFNCDAGEINENMMKGEAGTGPRMR